MKTEYNTLQINFRPCIQYSFWQKKKALETFAHTQYWSKHGWFEFKLFIGENHLKIINFKGFSCFWQWNYRNHRVSDFDFRYFFCKTKNDEVYLCFISSGTKTGPFFFFCLLSWIVNFSRLFSFPLLAQIIKIDFSFINNLSIINFAVTFDFSEFCKVIFTHCIVLNFLLLTVLFPLKWIWLKVIKNCQPLILI